MKQTKAFPLFFRRGNVGVRYIFAEYLSYRMKGKEPFHLVDAVKECGFNSLDEYFAAKRKYEVSQMSIVKIASKDAAATIQDFIANKKHGFAYCVHDEKLCFVAGADAVNEDACAEFGYHVIFTQHTGGAVVVNKGDISVVHFGVDYTAGFIGINTNLDHIKAICRKPMKKVPKGLSEYGITTEEVEQMFLEFCEQEG